MDWFTLSVLSALFSAFIVTVRKKAMKRTGFESIIGTATFLIGGLILCLVYFLITKNLWPTVSLSPLFWKMVFLHAILEAVAIWFLLRAMHYAEVTYTAPLLPGVNIFVLIVSFLILHEQPSLFGILGVIIIVLGIIMINYDPKQSREIRSKNIKGLYFLLVTIACWTFTPIIRKVALNEIGHLQNGPLFFAYILGILTGLVFLISIFLLGENKKMTTRTKESDSNNFLILIILLGLIYAINTWTHYTALSKTFTTYAMVIKDTAPIFVFIIGYLYFKEKQRAVWKLIATSIIIIGSIILALS